MAFCNICSNEYPDKRKQLGYETCLSCGDKIATKEAIRKSKCVAPLFNKGGYGYISSVKQAKSIGR